MTCATCGGRGYIIAESSDETGHYQDTIECEECTDPARPICACCGHWEGAHHMDPDGVRTNCEAAGCLCPEYVTMEDVMIDEHVRRVAMRDAARKACKRLRSECYRLRRERDSARETIDKQDVRITAARSALDRSGIRDVAPYFGPPSEDAYEQSLRAAGCMTREADRITLLAAERDEAKLTLVKLLEAWQRDQQWARGAGLTHESLHDVLVRLEQEDISEGKAVELIRAMLLAATESLTIDRDEWKQQHENLLSCMRVEQETIARIRSERDEAQGKIRRALDAAGNRWSEWGDRALTVAEILEDE